MASWEVTNLILLQRIREPSSNPHPSSLTADQSNREPPSELIVGPKTRLIPCTAVQREEDWPPYRPGTWGKLTQHCMESALEVRNDGVATESSRLTVGDMPKAWQIYPWTKAPRDLAAQQRLFLAGDVTRPGRLFLIRASHNDGERIYDQMVAPGTPIPFDVTFDDLVEIEEELPPPPAT